MNNCSICFENIPLNSEYITECQHYYHDKCIKKWLHKSTKCPICRQDINNYDKIITYTLSNEADDIIYGPRSLVIFAKEWDSHIDSFDQLCAFISMSKQTKFNYDDLIKVDIIDIKSIL